MIESDLPGEGARIDDDIRGRLGGGMVRDDVADHIGEQPIRNTTGRVPSGGGSPMEAWCFRAPV